MVTANILLSNILLILLLFCFIKEYYSITRFIKGILIYFKNYKYKIIYLLYLYSIYNIFYFSYTFVVLSYLFYIFIILFFPHVFFKLHKKGIRLLIVSFTINSFLNSLNTNIILPLILFNALLSLFIGQLILSPLESLIKTYYLSKARRKLKKINPLIIGITGSFSKTTFKTYLYHILKAKYVVRTSLDNINTLMGLTKWINNDLSSLCEVLILEMGIDKYHGIRKFSSLVKLDIAVITSVGNMHLSTFKTYERLLISKCEIDKLVNPGGRIFINDRYDDIKSYSFIHNVTVYGNHIYDDKLNLFQNESLDGAIKIGKYLFINEEDMLYRIKTLPSISRRFEIKENEDMILINDSYNINYMGVKEALNYMKKFNYFQVVITGGLIELGKSFYKENYELGKLLKDVNYVFLFSKDDFHPLKKGYEENSLKKCFTFKSISEIETILKDIHEKKIVLLTAIKSDFFLE